MTRVLTIAAALAVLVAGGAAYLWTSQTSLTLPQLGAAEAQTAAADIDTSGIQDFFEGDANAPVTVIEYASFTCPHCRSFHEDMYPDLKKAYVDTGQVKFVLREFYRNRFDLWAGMLARCAGEERYFGVVDLLLTEQAEWTANGDPGTIIDNLRKIGLRAGMTGEEIDACMQDGDNAQALVAYHQKNAEADSVTGTPTFVVNGRKQRIANYGEFTTLLDGLLEK